MNIFHTEFTDFEGLGSRDHCFLTADYADFRRFLFSRRMIAADD